ncbi:pentapeptide repeat-containing protein [Streptomyces sp. NBC_01422]|uniref:pentapeptide repeat-containing protein n=1 Tax=Streptomyces sp. NBC_01422 TaxID=2903859 RepID=UPI002E28AB76|nr:pentapeptide repeat-containing protein [Streptomyces sp. NBC_01422]
MTTTGTPPAPALSWPHCALGASAADPVGCQGIKVAPYEACLFHQTDPDRNAYLAGLTPGSDIDHRGTTFTGPLLNALLDALRDPATGHPRLASAQFDSATFQDTASFEWATFEDAAQFGSATFQDIAWFNSATFQDTASFDWATFEQAARFGSATFANDDATLTSANAWWLLAGRKGRSRVQAWRLLPSSCRAAC